MEIRNPGGRQAVAVNVPMNARMIARAVPTPATLGAWLGLGYCLFLLLVLG